MLGIAGFFMKRRKPEGESVKTKTAPIPVVSREAIEMRKRADNMLSQAEEVYEEAVTMSAQLEQIRSRDNVVATLLKPRTR